MNRKIIDNSFIARLESLTMHIGRPAKGIIGGIHKSSSYGNTVEFADFREYVPGDDLRRLDWNVYSRFEKYIVKLFTDERKLSTHVYIDCSESMQSGEPEKAVLALKLAAAFGYLSVMSLDRVSYQLMVNGKCHDLCGLVSSVERYYDAVARLSNVQFGGDTDIKSAIQNSASPGYDDGLSIIVSDFLTDSDWKNAVDFLRYRKRDVLLIQVLSPDEIDPDVHGKTQMLDIESIDPEDIRNTKMDVNRSAMTAYSIALNEYLEEIKSFCKSREVGYMMVSSDSSFEDIMFKKGYETGFVK